MNETFTLTVNMGPKAFSSLKSELAGGVTAGQAKTGVLLNRLLKSADESLTCSAEMSLAEFKGAQTEAITALLIGGATEVPLSWGYICRQISKDVKDGANVTAKLFLKGECP